MLKSYVKIIFEILNLTKHFEAHYLAFNFYIIFPHAFRNFYVQTSVARLLSKNFPQ